LSGALPVVRGDREEDMKDNESYSKGAERVVPQGILLSGGQEIIMHSTATLGTLPERGRELSKLI